MNDRIAMRVKGVELTNVSGHESQRLTIVSDNNQEGAFCAILFMTLRPGIDTLFAIGDRVIMRLEPDQTVFASPQADGHPGVLEPEATLADA